MYIASNLHELVITMYLYDIGHVITKSLHGYVSLVNYGKERKANLAPAAAESPCRSRRDTPRSINRRVQKEGML